MHGFADLERMDLEKGVMIEGTCGSSRLRGRLNPEICFAELSFYLSTLPFACSPGVWKRNQTRTYTSAQGNSQTSERVKLEHLCSEACQQDYGCICACVEMYCSESALPVEYVRIHGC